MFLFEFNILLLLFVLFVGYFVNLSIAWSVHYFQHQTVFGFPTNKIHFIAHHSLEWESVRKSYRFYILAVTEHITWVFFTSPFLVLYYVLFPNWLSYSLIAQFLIIVALTYYLHLQYDNKDTWLNRYAWFRRDRKRHQIHHRCPYEKGRNYSFEKSRNYSFGGLWGHWPDRLFGTFEEVK